MKLLRDPDSFIAAHEKGPGRAGLQAMGQFAPYVKQRL